MTQSPTPSGVALGSASDDDRRLLLTGVLVAGMAVTGASIGLATLPWPDPLLPLPPWVLPIMALAGTVVALLAVRCPPGPVRAGVLVLAVSVLAYPLFLGAACASLGESELAGGIVVGLAMTGHIVPLVMLQLLPVLAMRSVSGRPSRWVPGVIIVLNGVDVVMVIAANALPVTASVLLPVSSVLWIALAAIAPIATWIAVTRTSGPMRHRAVLIAISSVISVLILAFCFALGLSEQVQRIGDAAGLAMLMIGFSVAAVSGAALVVVGVGPASNWWLRTRVLGRLLAAVLLAAVALVAVIVALIGAGADLGTWEVVLLAVSLGLITGIAGTRLHGWATRIVDPVAELRAELSATGSLTDGTLRGRTELALQRAVNDPGLRLVIEGERAAAGSLIALTRNDDPRSLQVFAAPNGTASARRVRRLGDLSSLMWAVLLEGEVSRERARADTAAAGERERLSRNLHDGLQSRLLGIALNLQLEGTSQPDPTTRGLIDETVAALRSAANEARVLADGRVPDALQRGGLRDAVGELVGALGSFVLLDIPAQRFPSTVEETGYFVVGEAVGNAIKHGTSRSIGVQVRGDHDGRVLTVTITDDGVGGADPRAGSGLRRLSERVAASGGILTVREANPHGTIVEASLPCA